MGGDEARRGATRARAALADGRRPGLVSSVGAHDASPHPSSVVADERTQLVGWLDLQRALVHYKCEGLSEQDAHRSVLPTSPTMTMAGLVSHLPWVEHC